MVKKVFRINILLDNVEWSDIEKFTKKEKNSLNLLKDIEVMDGNNTYNFEIKIFGGFANNVFISIRSNYLEEIDLIGGFGECYYRINSLIGVKESVYNSPDGVLCFYFNINRKYDKSIYIDKYNFLKEKLDILKNRLMKNPKETYLEIAYSDFTKEDELALASYCLLACPETLLSESKSFDLFKDKFYFIGEDFERFKYLPALFEVEEIRDYLCQINTSKELLNFLLGYINFIKFSDVYMNERTNADVISMLGYMIYDNYIMSLND